MSDEAHHLNSIKVILLGESGVGKTSIIKIFQQEQFNENVVSTLCCNFVNKSIEIENKEYILEIWDTAGQEKFRSLNQLFIKDSSIIILVYDISNKNSFSELSYWYDFINEHLNKKDFVLGLVGNKADLFENENVTEQEGRNYASEIDAYFSLISAKTDKKGLDSFFEQIVTMHLRKNNKLENPKVERLKITKDKSTEKTEKKGFCGGGKNKRGKICELKNDDNSIKIIFLGNNKVGKTSIIKVIKGLELPKEYESTSNISQYSLTYTKSDKKYNINIIDTNGDFSYHSELEKVIKKSSIFIIVFDLNDKVTFSFVSKWLDIIKEYIRTEKDSKILVILGNKKNQKQKNCITNDEGSKFAQNYNASYLEISIGEKHNLKNMIKNLLDELINNIK